MALPTVSGTGYLLSDGVELKFSASGSAWARLPLIFKNTRKDANGNWTHDKEIKLDATVFGPLAEYLADNVEGRQDIFVAGTLHTEDWEDKEGNTRTSIRLSVSAAAPVGKARVAASVGSRAADDAAPF